MTKSYTRFERLIAAALSRFPGIKKVLKRQYQRLNFALSKQGLAWESPYRLRKFEYEDKETFFGYYDRSPESPDGRYVLYHAVNSPSYQLPLPEEIAYIIVIDQHTDTLAMECSTTSFNWQQGARAMWLDNDRFIFNDYNASEDHYVARIHSVSQKKVVKLFDRALYDAAGDVGVSLNFDRLQRMRPDYGYRDRNGKISPDEWNDKTDGVFLVDLLSGESRLFLSLAQLKSIGNILSPDKGEHWVNHLMISPDQKQIIFLHRWVLNGKVHHRLIYTPLDDANPRVLAEGLVSHCCWNGNDEIIAYIGEEGMPGDYYRISISGGRKIELAPGQLIAYGDGHPSVFNNKMLFDTYPDRSRMKSLLLMSLDGGGPAKLGEFFESLKFSGSSRCDLHPRWGAEGKSVYFDSVHEGKRRLYSINLDES